MARRRYRTRNEGPLHTSYVAGKSFYRAAWLRSIDDEHLSRNVPHERYLHDTPAKALFALPDRHRSHGCVRVQNALQFAAML